VKKIFLSITLLLAAAFTVSAQFDTNVFMWRGRQALNDGKYAAAIEHFNFLSRIDTSNYWSFFFRGIAKYNLGDLRGARTDFDKSVSINPLFTNGYHYRAITGSRFGDYDAALADYEKAIELRPDNMGIYFSRAVTFFLARKFDSALADFNRYIKRETDDPSAYLNRGACYLFLSDTTKALTDFNKAIKLDRYDPEGYIRRASLYADLKEYSKAVDDLDNAINLDSSNNLAYFNRALLYYELQRFNEAVADLNKVLENDPGNALTLYNRSLIYAQVGALDEALEDIDRVLNINPDNVLAHFNRAAIFVQMERWNDALADYSKSIELYPDFAKAYLNRSYVESMLGLVKASKLDYQIAQQKVREYKARNSGGSSAFADTTARFNSLLALDADFAKKDFDDELLQHRDIDVRLRPLYKFGLTAGRRAGALPAGEYENALLDRFLDSASTPVDISNNDSRGSDDYIFTDDAQGCFLKGLQELQNKQFTSASAWFDLAVSKADSDKEKDRYARYYKAFYLLNRAVLKAEMIDFIASLNGVVQTLSMDDQGTTRARVSDRVNSSYDYSEAIEDLREAIRILPDIPYFHFDLGNLHCLSSDLVSSIKDYDRAVELYPGMGDAYFNRGLVLIYLKDKEKGCIDLSRAGELGVRDAYGVILKYCEDEKN